jgi:predicted P-loop ATPase
MHIREFKDMLNNTKGDEYRFTARCPAHDDKTNSLSVSLADDKILIKCHAGCDINSIVGALGINIKDLFLNNKNNNENQKTTKTEYKYFDLDDNLLHTSIKITYPNGKKKFWQNRPDPNNPNRYINNLKDCKTVLYNLKNVVEGIKKRQPIFIVEGEKDCHTLINLGFIATTNPMGAGKWKDAYNVYLNQADIYIIPDNDEAGKRHSNIIGNSLLDNANSINIINLSKFKPDLKEKADITDYLNYIEKKDRIKEINKLMNEADLFNKIDIIENKIEEKSKKRKEKLSMAILEEYLESKNIMIKYNEISHKIDIIGFFSEHSYERTSDTISIKIVDELQEMYSGVNKGIINDLLFLIGDKNRYNPIIEILENKNNTWDGKNRFQELLDILHISKKDELSPILIKKWLLQCIYMAFNTMNIKNDAYGADGVLVLAGDQGIGKTSFFRKLSIKNNFFLEGAYIDFREKDTIIRSTSYWITELGELESTLKYDIEKLKAFLTKNKDEYRRPYGMADISNVRRTSFCATCNNTDYLIDQTGNRRFWTVPVSKINLEELNKLDMLQLWLEIYNLYKNDNKIQSFRLNKEEQGQLENRNKNHDKPIKALDEIKDILAASENNPNYEYKAMTLSEFKENNITLLGRYNTKIIGKAIQKTDIQFLGNMRINENLGRYYNLPYKK